MGNSEIKCQQNGGCPFLQSEMANGFLIHHSCRFPCEITPDLFPILRAMIAGEWKCETCKWGYPGKRQGEEYHCWLREPQYCWPCSLWQPRKPEEE